MKLSLDTVGYGGYFTAPGEKMSLEEGFKRAAKFGYDAVCIYAHRPLGFPLDLDVDRRKKLKDLARSLDLELGAVVCCTNYMEADHVLLYHQEKEILYTLASIDLAKDMGMGIVRVLAGFFGYFQNLYAKDRGITLALQTHPEITGNNEETLEMIDEVGVDSLKVGLDLPLFESQDSDFVRSTVRSMKGLMVYSHSISIAPSFTVGGAVYAWEEVVPGSRNDPCKWEVFLETCKEIGYDGLLSHEQCSPIIVRKGHTLGGVAEVDSRYAAAIGYFKPLLKKLKYYSGRRQ